MTIDPHRPGFVGRRITTEVTPVMSDSLSLDHAIADVAASWSGPKSLVTALDHITGSAVASVPGVTYASVSIRHPTGRLETVAPTDPLMYAVDGLQYDLNEGPCYGAVTDADVLYCSDLTQDHRWPEFGPMAAELGVLSLLAIRLTHPGGWMMALNLYADVERAFDDYRGIAARFTAGLRTIPAEPTVSDPRAVDDSDDKPPVGLAYDVPALLTKDLLTRLTRLTRPVS